MLTKKNLFIIWIFGIISGFTISISGSTLNFWLSINKIDIRTIGIFALISLPYAINFLWAPIFDSCNIYKISNLIGRRLSWLLLMQMTLIICILVLSSFDPLQDIGYIAMLGILISLFASAQDSILGAMRSDLIPKNNQGKVSGLYIFGYRLGMLVSGSGAIYLSSYMGWNLIYQLTGFILLIFSLLCIVLLADKNIQNSFEESLTIQSDKNLSFVEKIINPIGTKYYVTIILIFLIFYRLPDNFVVTMINPFLIDIGYNESEIATAGKMFGILSAMLGGFLGSYLMKNRNLLDSLQFFAIIHALAHLLFIGQYIIGKNIYVFYLLTAIESITGGMAMTAYIAFITSLCSGKYKSTQYSLLSAMMGLSRSILPSMSGFLVSTAGWKSFFFFTTLAIIPALFMLRLIKRNNKNMKNSP